MQQTSFLQNSSLWDDIILEACWSNLQPSSWFSKTVADIINLQYMPIHPKHLPDDIEKYM